uniref:DUF5641 domain-containing protein n=1 Tax=Heterorhabditis bacteriophora TaxID=37862 RepID=A0A1I7WA09_HETBA
MADQRINWIFNPSNSPWMAGVWERLVQSVKRAYNKMVGRRKLSLIEMQTVVTMIEAILNTRPITHINPADVMALSVEDSENYYDPDYNYQAINSVNQVKEVIQNIDRHKIRFCQGSHGRRHLLLIREVVLIEHELSPRRMWHYDMIIEIVKCSDGEIRSAKLRSSNGRFIHGPINKLYPMQIRAISPQQSIPITNMMGDPNLEYEEEIAESMRALCNQLPIMNILK